jgi:hypothetical protein
MMMQSCVGFGGEAAFARQHRHADAKVARRDQSEGSGIERPGKLEAIRQCGAARKLERAQASRETLCRDPPQKLLNIFLQPAGRNSYCPGCL